MNNPVYNFVIDYPDDELQQLKKINMEEGVPANTFSKGNLSWCLQTYLVLNQNSTLKVLCSNQLREDCINIVHSDDLLKLQGSPQHFIVCVRADYPPRAWAHYHIVQNRNQITKDSSAIYLWLQPGLIKRNSDRTGVSRIAYAGQTFNGNMVGSIEEWKNLLEEHQLEFVTIPDGQWHNLRDIDVLVGIRTFDKNPHNTKPPSKLFNSWHAQIPFIGGYDSAFMQVGKPEEDYLLATTEQEVKNQILRLKTNPELYSKLVANGNKKAERFNNQQLIKDWEQVLTGPILDRYRLWKQKPLSEKLRFSLLLKLGLAYHASKQIIKKAFRYNKA